MTLIFEQRIELLRLDLATLDVQREALITAIDALERGQSTVALKPAPKSAIGTGADTTGTPATTAVTTHHPRRNPTRPATPAAGRRVRKTTYTLDQVADAAQEALATGRPAERHIADTLNITISAAKNAMTRARTAGILGPRPTGHTDPITRHRFDPDQARNAAADAL